STVRAGVGALPRAVPRRSRARAPASWSRATWLNVAPAAKVLLSDSCLPRRALEDPVHGQCGVRFESRRLQQLVVLGADELAICRGCYETAAHFGRLSRGHPILFDLEQLP